MNLLWQGTELEATWEQLRIGKDFHYWQMPYGERESIEFSKNLWEKIKLLRFENILFC